MVNRNGFLEHSVTYMPGSKMYIDGYHQDMPSRPRVLATTELVETKTPIEGTDGQYHDSAWKAVSTPVDPQLYAVARQIAAQKTRIRTGQLTAADIRIGGAELDPLVLVRLHDQLMGEQMKWFHLDAMFTSFNLNQLVYRMSFKDNVAAAQEVPERAEYDITKVAYDDIDFRLTKLVTAYDITIEDTLRATLDPVAPLKQSNDYAMAFQRERRALAALKRIGNHYKKDATTVKTRFEGGKPTDDNVTRISNPGTLEGTGKYHSEFKVANELQIMKNQFMEAYDMLLTHAACSPNTAMAIAQNTWTEENTLNKVSAFRTSGGVRAFPGLSDTTMVVSQIVPDNVLYFTCKPSGILVKAEGPKISKAWEDNNKYTQMASQLDFNQYKCAHEDITNIKRRFGVIVDLSTAT